MELWKGAGMGVESMEGRRCESGRVEGCSCGGSVDRCKCGGV